MNLSSLSAADRRFLILGAAVALLALLSFMDPSGSWGAVMVLSLLGGLLAVFVALQPQLAPTMKLPMTKGLTMLVAGALGAIGFVIAGITWLSFVFDITRIFSILFDIGLVASIVLLYYGWLAYNAEAKGAAAAAAAAPAAAPSTQAPPPAPSAPSAPSEPPAPPPPPATEG